MSQDKLRKLFESAQEFMSLVCRPNRFKDVPIALHVTERTEGRLTGVAQVNGKYVTITGTKRVFDAEFQRQQSVYACWSFAPVGLKIQTVFEMSDLHSLTIEELRALRSLHHPDKGGAGGEQYTAAVNELKHRSSK